MFLFRRVGLKPFCISHPVPIVAPESAPGNASDLETAGSRYVYLKTKRDLSDWNLSGTPGEIRTPDPLLRRQVLYPAELRAHMGGAAGQTAASRPLYSFARRRQRVNIADGSAMLSFESTSLKIPIIAASVNPVLFAEEAVHTKGTEFGSQSARRKAESLTVFSVLSDLFSVISV